MEIKYFVNNEYTECSGHIFCLWCMEALSSFYITNHRNKLILRHNEILGVTIPWIEVQPQDTTLILQAPILSARY